MYDYSKLPGSLKETASFCCFRIELVSGRMCKRPYNPHTRLLADASDRSTFSTYEKAVAVLASSDFDGIGIGLFDDLVAIAIDHCILDDGSFTDISKEIIEMLQKKDAYIEVSPSGQGIRIVFRCHTFYYDKKKFYTLNHGKGLEVYVAGATSKYVTLTGNALHNAGVLPYCDNELTRILETYMLKPYAKSVVKPSKKEGNPYVRPSELEPLSELDNKLLDKARDSKHGKRFSMLYDEGKIPSRKSPSEADQMLCNDLAFWTNKDIEWMDKLFRHSKLMRDKWDRDNGASTYGQTTMMNSVSSTRNTYKKFGDEMIWIKNTQEGKCWGKFPG